MAVSSVISIDAMGGDLGVSVTVPGLALALKHLPAGVRFVLHGDEAQIGPELVRFPGLAGRSEVRHTDLTIASDEKPAVAVRRGRGSSMWNSLESVKSGEAAAAVSCGSTGSLMAIARLVLRMSVPMDRPPLVVPWPGLKGVTTFLDAGANVDCDAERLVEFAILGEAYHRVAYGVERPRVGILNIGSEDMKGHDAVQQAHALLRSGRLDIAYHGFVEGDDLSTNLVDVVVTDGFTGNVALKTGEGAARYITEELRAALTSSLPAKIAALLARPALKRFKARITPTPAAPLLGLNGLVIKCHGAADAQDFGRSVGLAVDLAASDFTSQIQRNMSKLSEPPEGDRA